MLIKRCLAGILILLCLTVLPVNLQADPEEFIQDNPIGACTHMMSKARGWEDTDQLIKMLKSLGVSVVRDEFAFWVVTEQQKGVYEIPEDNLNTLRKLDEAGIKVIFVLNYINPIYPDGIDTDAYAKYAAYVARRLRGTNIIAYELWNEPHNFYIRPTFGGAWNGNGDSLWMDVYTDMVAKASAAIRAVDQDVKILASAGCPSANGQMLLKYADKLKAIDGLSIHPYTFTTPPETIGLGGDEYNKRDGVTLADDDHSMTSFFKHVRELSRQQLGRELEIWVTEFGYTTFNQHPNEAQRGMYSGFTEEAQAAYHSRAILQAMANGLNAWCIYDLMDEGPNPYAAEENFGLFQEVGRDCEPKPSAACISNISALIRNGWKPVESMGKLVVDSIYVTEDGSWQSETTDPLIKINGPQIVWISTPNANLAFVWMAGRIDAEHNPPLSKITLSNHNGISGIKCYDLSNNEELGIEVTQEGDSVVINNIPVRYMPCVVKWPKQ